MHSLDSHKTERIGIRTSPEIKQILKRAAQAYHLNITDFLIHYGLQAATQALTDRRMFSLTDEDWSSFMTVLDKPSQDKRELKALLQTPSLFES